MPQGRSGIAKRLPDILANLVDRLPTVLIDSLREQFARVGRFDEEVVEIERRLHDWYRQEDTCRRLAEVSEYRGSASDCGGDSASECD